MLGIVPGTETHDGQVRKVATQAQSKRGWGTDRRTVNTSLNDIISMCDESFEKNKTEFSEGK